jgi:hypothetical protein
MIAGALLFLVLAAVACGAFQLLGRHLLKYRLTDDSVQVLLFGFAPLLSIRYSDIADVRQVSFRETLRPSLSVLRLGNRIVGNILLIQKKTGIVRTILITPDDAGEYAGTIKEHQAH